MDDGPHDPGNPALQPIAAEIENRGVAADDGGVAAVAEAERRHRNAAPDIVEQRASEVATLLVGDLRQSGERLAVGTLEPGEVADDVDSVKAGNGKIRRDADPPLPVRVRRQPGQWRAPDAGAPDHRSGGNALAGDYHAVGVDLLDRLAGPHGDAEPL